MFEECKVSFGEPEHINFWGLFVTGFILEGVYASCLRGKKKKAADDLQE